MIEKIDLSQQTARVRGTSPALVDQLADLACPALDVIEELKRSSGLFCRRPLFAENRQQKRFGRCQLASVHREAAANQSSLRSK